MASTLADVLEGMSREWMALGALRRELIEDGVKMSGSALNMRLYKLMGHGLVERVESSEGYLWRKAE